MFSAFGAISRSSVRVAWAGDIYQKFEAMCLEVEEVMYQDSVKYVENQTQKFGASVKKFYSEVMQDLLPSSCVDPVEVAAGDLSLNPYAHADLSKKPKSFLLDSPRELKKIKTEDEATSDTILPSLCSGVLVQNTSSDLCSLKSKKLGVYRRPIGIKRISQLDRPSKVSSPATSSLGLGSSESASSCGGNGSHVNASGDMNLKSSSISVERCDPEPVNESTPVSYTKFESSVSDNLISAGSVRQKKDESECTTPLGTSVNGSLISQKGSNDTTNACDIESVGEKVMTSDDDPTMKNDSFFESTPDISSNTWNVEFAVDEVVLSNEGKFDMEMIQNEEAVEPSTETFGTFEGSNLEESCVFVEGDNLDFVSLGKRKHKSYKKKIRDAISSKLRSTNKKGSTNGSGKNNPEETIPALSLESVRKQKITDHDSLESEWELL